MQTNVFFLVFMEQINIKRGKKRGKSISKADLLTQFYQETDFRARHTFQFS